MKEDLIQDLEQVKKEIRLMGEAGLCQLSAARCGAIITLVYWIEYLENTEAPG